MKQTSQIIIADYTDQSPVNLTELCEIFSVSPDYIQHLIEYEIVSPQGEPENWQFNIIHLKRIKTTIRLQRDLDVNLAGAALILDLLEEMETLREKVKLIERSF